MKLNRVQRDLQRVYDLETPHRVEDFLLHDQQIARALHRDFRADVPEQLLIGAFEDACGMSLYLDPTLMQSLADDSPHRELHERNLAAFLVAVEGVSHFLHTAWSALHDRRVTQLELELIAEIDKYLLGLQYVARQRGNVDPAGWHRIVFGKTTVRADLEPEQSERYRTAHRLAARFCTMLAEQYDLAPPERAALAHLRRFCRWPRLTKMAAIDRHRR